jgi:hypothetical protein
MTLNSTPHQRPLCGFHIVDRIHIREEGNIEVCGEFVVVRPNKVAVIIMQVIQSPQFYKNFVLKCAFKMCVKCYDSFSNKTEYSY